MTKTMTHALGSVKGTSRQRLMTSYEEGGFPAPDLTLDAESGYSRSNEATCATTTCVAC
jgi:hypothetical protein